VPLGRFLSAIERKTATMTAQQLRDMVLALARAVEASERPALLERFGAGPARPAEPGEALLADIEVLEERTGAAGGPGDYDYDDYDDHHDWSYEDEEAEPEWAPDFADLLRRAGAVFLDGDVHAAAQAYERLFTVAGAAVDDGWYLTEGPGGDGLERAAARYMRAVGELGEREGRPARLHSALSLVLGALAGDGVTYAAVEGSRAGAPAGREALLEDWVTALESFPDGDDLSYDEAAHRLLLEVVEQLEGLDGLAGLARRGGRRAGRDFLAWFDAALRQGEEAAAVAAGEEGLRALGPGPERAALAERMAVVARRAGRTGDELAARVEAWRSQPCLGRLLRALGAARRAGAEAETANELARSRSPSGVPAPLRAVLLVLGGRLDKALEECRKASAEAAGKRHLPADVHLAAEVLAPVLLAAGADATRSDGFAGSVTAGLLDSAETLVDRGPYRAPMLFGPGDGFDDLDDAVAQGEADGPALGDALVRAIESLDVPAAKRRRYLDAGATLVQDAVGRIVGGQERRRYHQAAALAVAHAEAVAITDGQAAGDAVAEAAQSRYPRHTAYRSQLVSARARSSLLTSPGLRR